MPERVKRRTTCVCPPQRAWQRPHGKAPCGLQDARRSGGGQTLTSIAPRVCGTRRYGEAEHLRLRRTVPRSDPRADIDWGAVTLRSKVRSNSAGRYRKLVRPTVACVTACVPLALNCLREGHPAPPGALWTSSGGEFPNMPSRVTRCCGLRSCCASPPARSFDRRQVAGSSAFLMCDVPVERPFDPRTRKVSGRPQHTLR
jgi:hypothetical protein